MTLSPAGQSPDTTAASHSSPMSSPKPEGPANSGPDKMSSADRFYCAAWRWHFYAGLYVAPFLVMAAITGLVMMYVAAFDGRDGEKISIVPGGEAKP